MIAKLAHFPLSQAWLCLDCNHVGNSQAWCPYCSASGSNLLSLAKVLNRTKEKEPATK